jgi:hypothetical protein
LQGRSEFTGCVLPQKCLAKHFRGQKSSFFHYGFAQNEKGTHEDKLKTCCPPNRLGGGSTFLESQNGAQNQRQAQLDCTWIRSLLFKKKKKCLLLGEFFALWGPRKYWKFLLF